MKQQRRASFGAARQLVSTTRHKVARTRWAVVVVGLLLLGCLTAAVQAEGSVRDGLPDGVAQIRRTEFGIPHILARDYGALGYGEGFAFGQDNPCVLVQQAITLAGDRSRWFGPTADAPTLELTGAPVKNLDSDLYYRSINATGQTERLLATPAPLGPTPEVRAVVAGYVRGYNRYLRDQGVANLPDAACRGAAWMRPITELDVWRRAYQFANGAIGGTGQFLHAVLAAAPPSATPSASAGVRPAAASVDAAPEQVIGSNGLALGAAATRVGAGMVLANPHGPWTGQERFYQMQLTVPGGLNESGVTFYGLPLIMPFGHTQHVAFTATAATDTKYTLQRLTLTPGDPTNYLVDGVPHAMHRMVITAPVLGADGKVSTQARTLYRTDDGPVIQIPGTYDWTANTAYVLHDSGADNMRALNEMLAMGRAQNLDQLRTAMNTYQGMPPLNVFAADASGTTTYIDASTVPHLTDAQAATCLTTAQDRARFAATGRAVLDGSRSACRPGSDPDAVQPGIFGPAELPHLKRSDFVANSNGSPSLVNPAQPLAYPRIVGDTGTAQRPRYRLTLDMVAQRIAGTDGLGAPGFTLDTLAATALGDRNFFGEQWRADLVGLCRAQPTLHASDGHPVDVRAACDALAGWDLHSNLDSHGEVLFQEFYSAIFSALSLSLDAAWAVPFDPTQPVTTPRGLNINNPKVGQALADAVVRMTAHNLALDTPVGVVQHVTTPDGPIPIHGCSEQCFNLVSPSGPSPSPGVYPDIAFGSGFLMAVELTPTGPRTQTLLAYGESDNPASPHHWDQARLFSAKHWITERFSNTEINTDPHRTTTTLHQD